MNAAARELLARLVAIDTTSRNSNLGLIEAVADYLDGYGVSVQLVHNERGDKANLFATIGPERDGGIVLSGHSDCVPVDGQSWSSDPFRAEARNGRIYGRGTCDMKGFIAVALSLVPEMAAAGLERPLHLVLSYDEELGCRGVPALLAKIAEVLPQPRVAIIGEPTGMRLVNAHKGIYAFETLVSGLEAHSSQTHVAVSAVVHGAAIVRFLDRLAGELAERGPRHDLFVPPYTTINIGVIGGGSAVNTVAGRCRIEWECRPVPGHDAQEIIGRLEQFVGEELLPPMRERFPQAEIRTERVVAVPPLEPGRAGVSPAEALVRRLTGSGEAAGVAFATEAGLFQQAGMSAVVIGPGSIEQAHKPDEYVSLEQLEACERFLRKLVIQAAEDGSGPASAQG